MKVVCYREAQPEHEQSNFRSSSSPEGLTALSSLCMQRNYDRVDALPLDQSSDRQLAV